jgi:hypothetical protein
MSHLFAAEWSMQPTLGWTTDYDSDRDLEPGVAGSEEAVLSADLRLQRSLENMQLMLEPHFDVRRYSDDVWGPGDDRNLLGSFNWTGERTQLALNGSVANQSTLTTELLETGIVNTDTRRRAYQGGLEWDWSRTDRHQSFVTLNYQDVSYSGPQDVQLLLPGYKYPSGTFGERFFLSEKMTFSVSAFGDALLSEEQRASSHEAGGQVEFTYSHSEKTAFDISVGESRRSVAGTGGYGTVAALSVNHNFELSTVSLSYSRNLVPYGIGFLVERQQVTAGYTRHLTPYLDTDFTVLGVRNNESAELLGLDRKNYENAAVGLSWKMSESWTLRPQVATSWSQPIQATATVRQWRAQVDMTWKPLASTISR